MASILLAQLRTASTTLWSEHVFQTFSFHRSQPSPETHTMRPCSTSLTAISAIRASVNISAGCIWYRSSACSSPVESSVDRLASLVVRLASLIVVAVGPGEDGAGSTAAAAPLPLPLVELDSSGVQVSIDSLSSSCSPAAPLVELRFPIPFRQALPSPNTPPSISCRWPPNSPISACSLFEAAAIWPQPSAPASSPGPTDRFTSVVSTRTRKRLSRTLSASWYCFSVTSPARCTAASLVACATSQVCRPPPVTFSFVQLSTMALT